MEKPRRVFCSHRSVDKPEVEAFARRLREAGIDAWFDQWEIRAGDDIVASMNRGLDECDVGLVFFSSKPWAGRWFGDEQSSLIVRRVEDGIRVIPVLIDADVKLPGLLRHLASRRIEAFDEIVAAINGINRKPGLGPSVTAPNITRFTVQLGAPADGAIDLVARRQGKEVARESRVRLPRTLQQNYAEFLQGHVKLPARGPIEARHESLHRALTDLGDSLGEVIFAKGIGDQLRASLRSVTAAERLELCFEATDSTLLALPFEAARLDGVVPALIPGVTVRRVVAGTRPSSTHAAAPPLKILVAVGAPDEGKSSNAVLDLERELQGILDAVSPESGVGNVEVRFLEVGHPSEIGRALARDAFHVLHLSGHGGPGMIELEDEDGAPVSVTATDLVAEIKRAGRNIPLVFLSSSHGGTSTNETTSLAVDLVREGVPLVLSMQTRVTDRYASDLSHEIYAALAGSETVLVSQALAVARQKLEDARRRAVATGAEPVDTQPEFATASLFGSEEEGALVDYALNRVPLASPPVHHVAGPVPQLDIGYLVGRRKELRDLLHVLRDHDASVAAIGKKAGVVLTGIGGVGKSSLAGRAMARLREVGWMIAPTRDRFNLGDLVRAVVSCLREQSTGRTAVLADQLSDPRLDDPARLNVVGTVLQTERILLVLDNFEDNLDVGGAAFLDETTAVALRFLAERAQVGKLLITCRYPVPDVDAWFAHQTLGPLSTAQTRKFLWRLPGLHGFEGHDLREVIRRIGGHPRMLEYLDGLLRKGQTRIASVTERLRKAVKDAGISLTTDVDTLDEAVRNTILLGARDILLDQLMDLADEEGDTRALLQCAVSALPIDAHGVAYALADASPSPEAVRAAQTRLARLVDLSLVTPSGRDTYWVHRWTAEAVINRAGGTERRDAFARAGRYRLSRYDARGIEINDIVEAARNFLDAQLFDDASNLALQIAEFLVRSHQSMAATTFVGEIVRRLPASHPDFGPLADIEAQNLLALGFTQRALERYQGLYVEFSNRAQAEPDRADYQRELSVSYKKLGDLYRPLGQVEQARDAYQEALAIDERLAQAAPDRPDYQRDLSISYNKMGEVYAALGLREQARSVYEKALGIRQRLAQADPDRPDYQLDLSISYERMGDLYSVLGEGEQARDVYEKALAIREPLAQAEPDRAEYQRALSVAYNKMGHLYRGLGQSEQASGAFLKDLAIAERLAQAEPDRADYQLELALSLEHFGLFSKNEEALARAVAILSALESSGRLNPRDRPMLERLRTLV
jgi:tetratricopeptide (TPR) repeat protein